MASWNWLTSRVLGVVYNLDRVVASAAYGTTQETISSMVGRRRENDIAAAALAYWLDHNTKVWGIDHTKKAIEHATRLDQADDGKEQ